MKERLLQLIEALNMTNKDFATTIGIQASTISHIKSGRSDVSADIIRRIGETLKTVNLKWFLLGEGEMFISAHSSPVGAEGAKLSSEAHQDSFQGELFQTNEDYPLVGHPSSQGQSVTSLGAFPQADQVKKFDHSTGHTDGPGSVRGSETNSVQASGLGSSSSEENERLRSKLEELKGEIKRLTTENSGLKEGNERFEEAKKIKRIIVYYKDNSYTEFVQ